VVEKTIDCPRCKLPQKGIDECEYCGLVFKEKSKTKKTLQSKNFKKDSLTNCRFCKAEIPGNAESCPHCGKTQIIKTKNIVWIGIAAFILIFAFVIPYFTEQSKDRPQKFTEQNKDRPKTEIKPTPKKVVSKSLDPEIKASIQKYISDWIRTKRFIKSGFWDESSRPHVFFELDVRYLGANPKMEAKQFSDHVVLQAVKIFKRDFCIHTYYGDHNKLSMSCEIFRD
jgi:RNA polymerase subunit RPABC4/transcription elongation factor Spt4